MLPFEWIRFDPDPDMYLTPISYLKNIHSEDENWKPMDPITEGGLIDKIEIYEGIPFAEVQEFHFI